MLILGRKPGEKVILTLEKPLDAGTVIEVCVSSMGYGGIVKLGFEAPEAVNIAREEILNRRYGRNHKAH